MSSPNSHLRPVTASDGGRTETAARQQPRTHASKALPTDRMKMDRQIAVLHAVGRLSGPRKNAVDADALSRAVTDIAPTTVILSNRFFEAAGWIDVPNKGNYAATDALVEYTRRLSTGTAEYAAEALRGPARQSWFWVVLEPHLADGQRLTVNDAEIQLMRAAVASDGHLPNIRNLIAWLEYAGMVTVRDQSIVARNAEPVGSSSPPQPLDGEQGPMTPPPAGDGKATVKGGGEPPATVVAFSVDLKVTADDLERLSADQIRALFEAVGTVIAIKQKD